MQDLGVDAAIIFADILLPLEPLGVGFEFVKGVGPRIHEPVRTSAQVDAVVNEIDPNETLLCDGGDSGGSFRIRCSSNRLAGASFTLASYVIR